MIFAPTLEEKLDYLSDKAAVFDEYVSALVAVDLQTDKPVYDYDRILESLSEKGMTQDQAIEWIDCNVIGTRGDDMPIIIERFIGGADEQ